MRRQVVHLSQRLQKLPQQQWALCFEDRYLFTVALLAALHAQKTPVIPGHCRQALLQEQLTEFDGLLTDTTLSLSCPTLQVEEGAEMAGDVLPPITHAAAVVLFTSGSTGAPRKIVKPVKCLDEEASWLAHHWGALLSECRIVASVSHQHLYGLTFCIWLPMALGLDVTGPPVRYAEQLAALPPGKPYAFISSPAFLRRLDPVLPAPDCRLMVSAGGVLPWPDAAAARQWFGRAVTEIYGSTETGVLAWRRREREAVGWQPFPGVTFARDGAQHWRVRSALIPQPQGIVLDDRLDFDAAGRFQLCGRQERLIKIEDKRISLSEIERRLLALPEVAEAVALPVCRARRSGIGVVLVLASPVQAAALPQLRQQWRRELHKWLEPVAIPRFWRIVDTLPCDGQGKCAWPQLKELFDVTD